MSFLALEDAMERLKQQSPREHEALTLRFYGGLTVAETAKLMDWSEATVEADCRVARAKLLAWMKKADPDV